MAADPWTQAVNCGKTMNKTKHYNTYRKYMRSHVIVVDTDT